MKLFSAPSYPAAVRAFSLELGFILAVLGLLTTVLMTGCRTQDPGVSARSWVRSWRASNPVWRGVHLSVQSDQQAEQLKAAIPALAATGVNVLVVEVDYSFEFQSHPELRSSTYLSKAGARGLTAAAHAHGIRLIPQFNCLGHQSWSKTTFPLLIKYPQFDETPGEYPDNKDIYCRSWCPQNPDVNTVVFALIDELI
ncbi:MAG: hypothetical protein ACREIC_25590, partial [Limisphaerales bacterium]